ncbi:MAG: UDP-glucose 4-epimerase GalE [Thermomicrobiales bacterium]|nr:UDP-glucose 4-epimerase GalE [Thermomicrobiales bacterium]
MRVLVTGGAGYVGRIAVELLLDDGHDVVVLDNFSKGHAAAIPAELQALTVDLRNAGGVTKAVLDSRPDAIIHFGAVTIVPESVRSPGLYYAVNTAGTNNLLSAAIDANVERFILSSTAAVYGTPDDPLVSENAPLRPISPYGSSKLMAETILRDFSAAYGLKYAVFRYFNVAGATSQNGEDHTPETHLIPSAIFAAMGRREPLTLFGRSYATPDGTAIRDYVHVVDLARAHMMALTSLEQSGEVFNLGAGEGVSVAQIIDAIERITGHAVPAVDGPPRAGDPPVLVADISRARNVLRWSPRQSDLDSIISSAWDWHERHPNGYSG